MKCPTLLLHYSLGFKADSAVVLSAMSSNGGQVYCLNPESLSVGVEGERECVGECYLLITDYFHDTRP